MRRLDGGSEGAKRLGVEEDLLRREGVDLLEWLGEDPPEMAGEDLTEEEGEPGEVREVGLVGVPRMGDSRLFRMYSPCTSSEGVTEESAGEAGMEGSS